MKRDEEGHEIATCTYESAACYVLDWYGIPGKYFTYLCWEAVSGYAILEGRKKDTNSLDT